MSAPCPHGNAMSEHCWSCDADHTARAILAERERCAKICERMVVGGRAWNAEQAVAADALFAAAKNIRDPKVKP